MIKVSFSSISFDVFTRKIVTIFFFFLTSSDYVANHIYSRYVESKLYIYICIYRYKKLPLRIRRNLIERGKNLLNNRCFTSFLQSYVLTSINESRCVTRTITITHQGRSSSPKPIRITITYESFVTSRGHFSPVDSALTLVDPRSARPCNARYKRVRQRFA